MKHIKPYKIFESASPNFPTTRDGVIELCREYEIENYTINDDLSIDTDGSIDLSELPLDYLPLRFNYIGNSFECDASGLKTLEGCPKTVEGNFSCSHNNLETLKGSPQTVGGDFNCSGNEFLSLEGCPQTVGGGFDCSNCMLNTLKGCPQTVGGGFYCYINVLRTLEHSPRIVYEEFSCAYNRIITLKGSPQTVDGHFHCYNNKLTDLEHFPEINGNVHIDENAVYYLVHTFIKNGDNFMIEDFVDYEIVRNRDTVMLDRLQTFIMDNNLEMPDLDEIKKHYKIIE